MKKTRILSFVMAFIMVLSSIPMSVSADTIGESSATTGEYVLMNIPYDKFYAGEGVTGNVDAVTTATVKTYNQTMAGGSYHAGYEAADPITDAKILGVTYPVYVADMSELDSEKEVKDADKGTITVAAGKSSLTEKEVSGKDLLFASGDYAYYVLDEQPSSYKALIVEEGEFTFSAVNTTPVTGGTMTVEMAYGAHYTNIEFAVTADEITDTAVVNAIILTTSDGGNEEVKYALRHVEDIWRKTSLGWNWDSLDETGLSGKTITAVTYYIQDNGEYKVINYDIADVNVKKNPGTETAAEFAGAKTITVTGMPSDMTNPKATVKTVVGRGQTATVIAEDVDVTNGRIATADPAEGREYVITITSDNYGDISVNATYTAEYGYVLMNIPYDKFFEAEGVENVDAVTTATVKTYNQTMAGGSYHAGYEAADPITDAKILGVTYPVRVDLKAWDEYKEDLTVVTEESTETITVAAGKSSTKEAEVSGKDLLFASGDYAYYAFAEDAEEPTSYKTLVIKNGEFTFDAASAKPVTDADMEVEMVYGAHYTDIEFNVTADIFSALHGDEESNDAIVNAITLTTEDGTEYALRHVENIWRKTSLGWNWEDLDGAGLAGKKITKVTCYTVDEDVYSIHEYAVDVTVKLNPGTTAAAAYKDANTITVTGMPSGITNPKATVQTKVGRGETATVIAENVNVVNGLIATTKAAEDGKTYTITIKSDNYGDFSAEASYTAPKAPVQQPTDTTQQPTDTTQQPTDTTQQPTDTTQTPADTTTQTPDATVTTTLVKGKSHKVGTHTYKVTKVGTAPEVSFVKTTYTGKTLKIPATVKINGVTCKVTAIAENALKNNKKLTKVVIGKNVKTIGSKAFYKNTKLTKITIPAAVKKIGAQAFYGCKTLKTVTVKSTKITSIGKKAFSGISSKAKITVPKSMKKAKKNALIKKIKNAGTPKKATVK